MECKNRKNKTVAKAKVLDDYNTSVITDLNGNVYITGHFNSTSVTFDATALINTSSTSGEIYIAKHNSNENLIWVKSAGGTSFEKGVDIFVDVNENIDETTLKRSLHS